MDFEEAVLPPVTIDQRVLSGTQNFTSPGQQQPVSVSPFSKSTWCSALLLSPLPEPCFPPFLAPSFPRGF